MVKSSFENLFDDTEENIVYDYELADFAKNVVIQEKSSIPRLFRYSAADYYNIRGLEMQSLFLSPIGNMNDVFEGLSCQIDDNVINGLEEFRDIAYLKSFSEEKNNLLMWAHYADNYSGMCVEYDFSHLPDSLLCHLFPVHYSVWRTSSRYLDYAIKEHEDLKRMNKDYCYPNDCDFLKDIMSLFLTKSKSWSYEREWRLLATYAQIHNKAEDLDDDQEIFYKVQSQFVSAASCIKAVYLGPKMKQNIKEHIQEICRMRLNNIPVYSSRLSKDRYELEFIPDMK